MMHCPLLTVASVLSLSNTDKRREEAIPLLFCSIMTLIKLYRGMNLRLASRSTLERERGNTSLVCTRLLVSRHTLLLVQTLLLLMMIQKAKYAQRDRPWDRRTHPWLTALCSVHINNYTRPSQEHCAPRGRRVQWRAVSPRHCGKVLHLPLIIMPITVQFVIC